MLAYKIRAKLEFFYTFCSKLIFPLPTLRIL